MSTRFDPLTNGGDDCGQHAAEPVPQASEIREAVSRADGLPTGPVILSFDVEEHYRIEAAHGLTISPVLKEHYVGRLEPSTRWLLDVLAERNIRATFFVVGQVAEHSPGLVRAIHDAGHEVASHSWAHERIHRMTPESFREDLRKSKDALEQVTGSAVVGFRAPTFSIVRQTAWALDVLVEEGFQYDSSIFPVRHDRYGVPDAPDVPFHARGHERTILEFPPLTLRVLGHRLPVGGGGYFRLLPAVAIKAGLAQFRRMGAQRVATLYFHPWEFDPEQERLPLRALSRWRTYVGIDQSRKKLIRLMENHVFIRAVDAAEFVGTRTVFSLRNNSISVN